MQKNNQLFQTRDRFEIYVLLASRCTVESYKTDERGITHFRFLDKTACEDILSKLLSKKLKVYAHEMVDAIRTAQAIFYNR